MAKHNKGCGESLRAGDTPIGSFDLDTAEFAVLCAARFLFLTFADSKQHSWLTAVLASDNFFPGPNHAETFRRVCAMVHEIRISRKHTLRFSNPRCECCSAILTQQERHMIEVLKAVRHGQRAQAVMSAMLLTEGEPADMVIAAAEDLATMLPSVAYPKEAMTTVHPATTIVH